MSSVRLFHLLAPLRSDQFEAEQAWEQAVDERRLVIARRRLTARQRKLVAEVDTGRLLALGQDAPDGQRIKGLKEIDEQAYHFYLHRGNPSHLFCRQIAEYELERERAPEWQRAYGNEDTADARSIWEKLDETFNRGYRPPRDRPGTPWRFVVNRLLSERAMPFDEATLSQAVLFIQVRKDRDVDPDVRKFVTDQDDRGYTNVLLRELWELYRSDAERLRLPKLEEAPPGNGGGHKAVTLVDAVPVVEVTKKVGRDAGRSDKLAEKMRRRNYLTEKRAGKWYCQRADAIAMFPRRKQRIEEI